MPGISTPAAPDIRFSDRTRFATVREEREITDLAALVLRDAAVGSDPTRDTILLEMPSASRSGAHVFKATPLARDGRTPNGVPTVVKIAPIEAGTSEKANYERFVLPLLPAVCRPDLLGFATAHDRAALCYSFVGDPDRPVTLTDRLAAGDLAALDFVLASHFDRLRECWYGAGQVRTEADLARYYRQRYFDDPGSATTAETILSGHAARFFDARHCARGYRIGTTVFPAPCELLFDGRGAHAYTSCILHGDMNSDNIVLDGDGKSVQLIDFRRTGRGHSLQDLAGLEASVRINYPSSGSAKDILEIERLIALRDPRVRASAYATAIIAIRETACRLFGAEEMTANYPFAVAAIGLRLMRAIDLSDAAHARISASALWGARALVEN